MVAAVTAVASATTEASGGFTYPWQAPPMYKAILTARMNELRKLDLLGYVYTSDATNATELQRILHAIQACLLLERKCRCSSTAPDLAIFLLYI